MDSSIYMENLDAVVWLKKVVFIIPNSDDNMERAMTIRSEGIYHRGPLPSTFTGGQYAWQHCQTLYVGGHEDQRHHQAACARG